MEKLEVNGQENKGEVVLKVSSNQTELRVSLLDTTDKIMVKHSPCVEKLYSVPGFSS